MTADSIDALAAELDHLANEAEALVEAEHSASTALVPTGNRSPVQLKQRLAATRSALARKRQEVEAKAGELKAAMDARLEEATRVIEPLRKQMARMEEGIWTINLYLGRDEELVQLRDGDPAPQSTPISVRQQVLAMDEESAVAAEDGGIDARTYDAGHVVIVMDDDMQLVTGRESFREWRRRLAAELRVGMRIVGNFDTSDFYYENRENRRRVHPQYAHAPETGVVYRLEDKTSDGFVIRYDRTDQRHGWQFPDSPAGWRGEWGAWPYEKRASCRVTPEDPWILPLDLADVDDMRRFLTSRLDRGDYTEMFPTLKAAIAAKETETAEEAPFRQLLAGRLLAADPDLDAADAEREATELVNWWKFTNRHHRPLLLDPEAEAQALRAMDAEAARRRADRARSDVDTQLVQQLRDLHPAAVAVARKRDGSLIVVVPADPKLNVYVHEYRYTSKGRPAKSGVAQWRLVGARPATWSMLWEADTWATWQRMASKSDHLTGPEVAEGVRQCRALVRADELAVAVAYTEDPKVSEGWGGWRGKFQLFVCSTDPAEIPDAPDAHATHREVRRLSVKWSRAQDGSMVLQTRGDRSWGYDEWGDQEPWKQHDAIQWHDADLAAKLYQEHVTVAAHNATARRWAERSHIATSTIRKAWTERAEAQAYERFLEDFQDPELWEGHRKLLSIHWPWHREEGWLSDVARRLLLAGVDLAGMTVADAVAMDDDLHHVPAVIGPDDWGRTEERIHQDMLTDVAALRFAAAAIEDEDEEL